MLFITLGLLLGAAALLWCFVLALTFADDDSIEGTGLDRQLSPSSVADETTGGARPASAYVSG